MKKICTKCRIEKELDKFHKDKSTKSGFRYCCKSCDKLQHNKYKNNNKEKIQEYWKNYYQQNKESEKQKRKEYYCANKESEKQKRKEYYYTNQELEKRKRREYGKLNRKKERNYEQNKLKKDIQFKLKKRLRDRLYKALKGNYKSGSAIKDLGCSIKFLKKYLEEKFYNNPETSEPMTWNNYGFYGWHIDHIKPLVAFDLKDRKQLLEACNYKNLQPLWAKENLGKKDKQRRK